MPLVGEALDQQLDRISTDAGVYLFKDGKGTVIYVGKAQNLRTRVRQYFRPGGDARFAIAAGFLARLVEDIETIVVTSPKEALLLENHLIKKHQPRFNVKLRDDKQYLVLRLADPKPDAAQKREQFPRVQVVRNIRDELAGLPARASGSWNINCPADMGDNGAAFVALPQTPPRNVTWAPKGQWVHLAKIAFERYFMRKMQGGSSETVYENYILKALGIERLSK